MIRPWRTARELGALLAEVTEVDWRNPSWWALVGGAATLARPGAALDPELLGNDGGPRADTLMGRSLAGPAPAARIARAVTAARAASRALTRLDGQFPGQPLQCELDVGGRRARRRRLAHAGRVLFATPAGVHAADLGDDGAGDLDLALALVAACTGRDPGPRLLPVDPASRRPTGAAIAVSLHVEEVATARHLHRRCWTAAGGPWLGLGWTAELEVVTTCHAVVDGYGHARIAGAVFEAIDRSRAAPTLLEAAVRRTPLPPALPGPVLAGSLPLGIATATVPQPVRFAEALYATGRALEGFCRRTWTPGQRRRARFTPTVQVPIAPGRRDDPQRLARRVVPGLLALAMRDGAVEPFDSFRLRLPGWLEREAAGAGLLTRLRATAAGAPLPAGLAQQLMTAGTPPRPWLPAVAVLAGRGCLSSLRIPADDAPVDPLFAVSAPALEPAPGDPRGGTVLTLVHGPGGCAVTVGGTGLAGTAAGAAAFLDMWRTELGALLRTGTRRERPATSYRDRLPPPRRR